MTLPRSSGLLLHPTSLPGSYGIGDLGREAHAFLDFLGDAGQSWWQVLPLGPVGDSHSPYQSSSSFAGNPLLISPEGLVEEGWLSPETLQRRPRYEIDRVSFPAVIASRREWLRAAFLGFDLKAPDYRRFLRAEAAWLPDYALFEALHRHFDDQPWWLWPEEIRRRTPAALRQWRSRLKSEIAFRSFVQFAFDRQWNRLRDAAHRRDIRLIGDVPIFVSLDSADVWARPELFELDAHGRPTGVSGVPPDYFAADGQLWGNPLYRWSEHAGEGYAWWIQRLASILKRVDLVRLDHFRGFEAYWDVPADAPTAAHGRWRPGPGAAFFEAVRKALGGLPLIAEDLGDISTEVLALRDQFELPGMRVLQFAFGNDSRNPHLPHNYPRRCVAYPGTHDNDTTLGWFRTRGPELSGDDANGPCERRFVRSYVGTDGAEIHWDLIRLALASVADLAVIPLQDVLGLGSEARMNIPGKPQGNWSWRWRPKPRQDRAAAERLRTLVETYGRSPEPRQLISENVAQHPARKNATKPRKD